MKYLRKFNNLADLQAAIQSSEISFLGLAYNNNTPVIGNKVVTPAPSTSTPFYVENITNSNETLTISEGSFWQPQKTYHNITLEKSTDGITWTSFGTTGSTALTQTLTPGDKLYLRANTNTWYGNENYCSILGVSKVGGNIMSLLYGSNFTGDETTFPTNSSDNFSYLFYNNTNLVNAVNLLLPATTLVTSCYAAMFVNCTSLTSAPALPATTLAQSCYDGMFGACTSLTTAPALPATTLANECYSGMFDGCTLLTTAPALPATTLADYCYEYMFRGCTSLTTSPVLPATTLASSCYSQMFWGCTSLTTAPVLPATTLANYCYQYMFRGCTSLTTAPTLSAITLNNRCCYYMFGGCTSLTTAPVLLATTLANECYASMFRDCSSLNNVTTYANDLFDEFSMEDWLENVAASGTFHNLGSATYESGASGIPSGWTEVHS